MKDDYTDYYLQNENDSKILSLQIAAAIFGLSMGTVLHTVVIKDLFLSDIEKAQKECSLSSAFSIGEDSESLSFQGLSDSESYQEQMLELSCVLSRVDFPQASRIKLESTNALMGRQSDEWEGYKAEWTYHPDNGLVFVLQEK